MNGLMTRDEQIAYNDRHRVEREQRAADITTVRAALAEGIFGGVENCTCPVCNDVKAAFDRLVGPKGETQ